MLFENKEGVTISLHIIPNAPKSQIIGPHNNNLKVKIKSPPVDGKANAEILRFFSELLGLPKNQLEIITGEKSKNKRLLIRNRTPNDIKQILKQATSKK